MSHDSYQIEVATGVELNASVRYKPNFLQEQPDGSWQYVRVARQFGQNRVLSADALRTIAEQTVRVTDAENENAKIEELGDVLEVLRGLASMLDVDWDDVEVTAETKRKTRGGFEKSAVLIETSRPKSNVSEASYDERRISLAELGSIVIEDNRVSVPFTRLVGKDIVSVMLSYRGGFVVLEIRFDEGALNVEVKSSPTRNIGKSQLDLFPVL